MTEFDFGNGLVPAHKHPNGGGWVADTARVDETAYVGENARVFGDARVFDNARIEEYAQVYDNAQVSENARVFDDAEVFDEAVICDEATVSGYTLVHGNARVSQSADISDNMRVVSNTSRTPIFIEGTKCYITTHDEGIKAGCLYMTDKEWNNTTDEEILDGYGEIYADDLVMIRTILKQRRKS